jgi:hypothetical protein
MGAKFDIKNSMKSIRIRCNAISIIRDENKCVDRKQINFTYNYKKASRLRSFFADTPSIISG